jgi:predicted Co/Zn/Cd cation transporter (cation efflux family)
MNQEFQNASPEQVKRLIRDEINEWIMRVVIGAIMFVAFVVYVLIKL